MIRALRQAGLALGFLAAYLGCAWFALQSMSLPGQVALYWPASGLAIVLVALRGLRWSLLVPAMERGGVAVAVVGLLAGAAFLWVADQLLPHLHGEFLEEAHAEGPRVAWQRSALLMIAMTLHNFPEGMAVGVSFAHTAGEQLRIGFIEMLREFFNEGVFARWRKL